MTTYILTGSKDRARENAAYAALLADELHKQFDTFSILSCFFAWPEDVWPMLANHWEQWFRKKLGSIKSYDYARFDRFTEQVKAYDVLYLHGGDNKTFKDAMGAFEPLAEFLKGKIVVGSSAGANLLAKNFWSSTRRKPFKGRPVLDINVMAHYGAPERDGEVRTQQDWDTDERLFQEYLGTDEKIWHVPEGALVKFEVDT